MRRTSSRKCIAISLGVIVVYICYRISTNILSLGWVEDIRDRAVLQARARNQLVDQKVLSDPSGQACRQPDLDVTDPSLAKYFVTPEPLMCDSEPDWVCMDKGYVFVCNETIQRHKDVQCTYTFLERSSDFKTVEGNEVYAGQKRIPLQSDFFNVKCSADDGYEWDNIMAGISRNPTAAKKAGWQHLPNDALGLNVLIWGHDSLSRMTFMRKLPLSYKYITEILGGIVLKGYNIVGDGTPQALIPILTGKTELELPETRKRMGNKAQFVNVYPFIWKDFEDLGYVTAYAEDCPNIGTFTYRLTGFKEQPTHHYMRTFYVAAENEFSKHPPGCLRAMPRHQVPMNWVKQFFTVYSDKPKFFFSFHSELSHGDYNKIGLVDGELLEMLIHLNMHGFLNNTLLILMSDHGHRFAEIRETQQGKQEERLPFFSFVFPPWFEQKYPKAMMNFRQNAERLTSPFDIYPTLYNVLHFEGPGKGSAKDRSISLFKEIPKSRTCHDADIEPHWCACLNWEPVSVTDPIVIEAANSLVKHINDLTDIEREVCEVLSLDKIVWSGKYLPTKSLLQFKKTADYDGFIADLSDQTAVNSELYQVKIHTQPGEGHFEASLKYDATLKTFTVKSSDISRVNKYGKAAECIEQSQEQLRKYCYCKIPAT